VARYCVAIENQEPFYIAGEGCEPWLSDTLIKKVVHDGKALARISEIAGIFFDTHLAAYLLNPGVRSQEISDLVSKWGSGQTLPSEDDSEFLAQATKALPTLRLSLEKELKSKNLWQLYCDLELPIAELLATMERRGIAVQ
jgi:DNA polymerase-1